MPELKGFYDYTEDELSLTLKKGTYAFKVTEAKVGQWDDGRLRLDLQTQVSQGQYVGKFGPRITMNVETEDRTVEGANGTFEVNAEESRIQLRNRIDNIVDGRKLQLPNNKWDDVMLNAIAKQVKGAEFIATCDEDKNGYLRAQRIYAMSKPPKSFVNGNVTKKSFNLDEV